MSTDKNYNLDENVSDSFKFSLKGHVYKFKQLNTEELEEFQSITDDKKVRQFLYKFITPIDEKDPPFEEAAKEMLAPHWKNFLKMIRIEMSSYDGN